MRHVISTGAGKGSTDRISATQRISTQQGQASAQQGRAEEAMGMTPSTQGHTTRHTAGSYRAGRSAAGEAAARWRMIAALSAVGVLAFTAVATGCGDDAGINDDASVDGDADLDGGITDAVVDNGPLDCGVSPADGAVCVTGRLYDFVTREPVMPGEELEVYSFYDGSELLEARDDPDYVRGRVAPSGRFYAWTQQSPRISDRCLAITGTAEGYSSGTVNCYERFGLYEELTSPYQFHLVPLGIYQTWMATFPGNADLTSARPLFLGQCLATDWTPLTSSDGTFHWLNMTNQITAECFSLSADRQEVYGEQDFCLPYRVMPESGASIYYVPLEKGNETFDFPEQVTLYCDDQGTVHYDYTLDLMESNESKIVVFNRRPRP